MRGLNYVEIRILNETLVPESFQLEFANNFWIANGLIGFFLASSIFIAVFLPVFMCRYRGWLKRIDKNE